MSLVGRNLAPHLKSVIGVWLCAQYDTYAPVASAAVNSFQAAFSDNKRIEAIMFCRKELLQVHVHMCVDILFTGNNNNDNNNNNNNNNNNIF